MLKLRLPILLFFIIIAIGMSLFLGARPLSNPDESRYAGIALHMVLSGNYFVPRVNGILFLDKPLLSYWLTALAIQSSGWSNGAARFFPAFFAWLGCFITYLVGKKLYSERAGVLSAAILATSMLYVGLSHYVNMDMEVGVCIAAALGTFLVGQHEVKENRSARAWFFWSYVFAALGFLFKGLIGIVLPGLVVFAWTILFFQWKQLRNFHLALGIIVILVLALPYYGLIQAKNPAFFQYFFVVEQFQRYVQSGFNNAMPFWFYFPIVLGGIFPWCIWLWPAICASWKIDRRAHRLSETGFLLLWILMILIFFSVPISKLIGYIIPVLPGCALLLGKYFDQILDQESEPSLGKYIWIYLILFLGVMVAGLIVLWTQQSSFPFPVMPPAFTVAAMAIIGLIWTYQKRKSFVKEWLLSIIVTIAAVLIAALYFSKNIVSPDSVVALLQQLKKPLPSNALIVSYQDYFEDLPIAFPHGPVSVVSNWDNVALATDDSEIGHFAWALQREPEDKKWLITENTFWKAWVAAMPVYVFLDSGSLSQFKDAALAHYQEAHVVQTFNGIALVTNATS